MKDRPITTIDKDGIDAPLTDVVYQRMLDSIYAGALAPGSVINEVELAREFGVSRGPVREAVRRLQGIQIVTREPYTKARVVTMTAASALELFQVRMGLEGVACFLATQRMSDAEIEHLQRDLESHQRGRTGHEQPDRHFDLHERIVRASGNQRIITALCDDLYHLLRIYRRHSGSVLERKDDALEEHWQIVRAISRRDARLAESLMRSHIERAANHVANQLSGSQ
ncbi:GntR family transcriptional regulator [Bordetella holmesii]|uniref:FCD domain protein n=2 Tax=Bordetella holmesii TaxID=35814 RepID=A0A158MA24_9BORD|nr:GntR family transcriptional regulator [Bordetella holmesii]AHV92448.1 bacterial regulatory s, gntR family protein [Bordetella holmesii ATCC 51541]AIT25035.1 bacterial regulatory s, gntR family protein [Bordetella holmesii 44057]EWM45600.1 bacterial regulatory s, gntR family protein [Bordetella holmesii 70147]EWM48466.1 bacterial regulatory s, gntR family protein [Bordetella holmesii 41130]EWM49722.1 bacterial regulatory s, gntR family protein [Bordetella holmesii 35009]